MSQNSKKTSKESKSSGNGLIGLGVLGGLILVVLLVVFSQQQTDTAQANDNPRPTQRATSGQTESTQTASLPKLLSLGANSCVPCKMMEPEREALKAEYEGKVIVEFIDVWADRSAGQKYGVRSIPTVIFYDASGKELYRHIGYMSKDDMVRQFKSLGIEL